MINLRNVIKTVFISPRIMTISNYNNITQAIMTDCTVTLVHIIFRNSVYINSYIIQYEA